MTIRFLCLIAWLLFLPLAFGAEQDALAIDANIKLRHMPYGGIMDPILSLPDLTQVVDYTRCGDSAIWTGHYLAAEAFRYSVTGAAAAGGSADSTPPAWRKYGVVFARESGHSFSSRQWPPTKTRPSGVLCASPPPIT